MCFSMVLNCGMLSPSYQRQISRKYTLSFVLVKSQLRQIIYQTGKYSMKKDDETTNSSSWYGLIYIRRLRSVEPTKATINFLRYIRCRLSIEPIATLFLINSRALPDILRDVAMISMYSEKYGIVSIDISRRNENNLFFWKRFNVICTRAFNLTLNVSEICQRIEIWTSNSSQMLPLSSTANQPQIYSFNCFCQIEPTSDSCQMRRVRVDYRRQRFDGRNSHFGTIWRIQGGRNELRRILIVRLLQILRTHFSTISSI